MIALPRQGIDYCVDTDAIEYQVGAARFQTDPNGESKPLGYWSRSLITAENKYSISEREWLAIVWALQTLSPYLRGVPFVFHSNHSALRRLMESVELSSRLMRWRLCLAEFDFRVEYNKGTNIMQSDVLSRLQTLDSTTIPSMRKFLSFYFQKRMVRMTMSIWLQWPLIFTLFSRRS